MKKLIIITSAIQTNNSHRFSHGTVRSAFTDEERFRQTLYTLNCLQNIFPNDDRILLDISFSNFDEFEHHANLFGAKYFSFAKQFPEEHKQITEHTNIAWCEAMLLNKFLKTYKKVVDSYDYVLKTTGRYFYSNIDNSIFSEENRNKMFFKHPFTFEWKDEWNFDIIDLRKEQNDNNLWQYSTVMYGFAPTYTKTFIDIFEAIKHVIENPNHSNFDMETGVYYFTRPYKDNIIYTDWKITGWEGVHAKFMHY
jgi:hypothetical protein